MERTVVETDNLYELLMASSVDRADHPAVLEADRTGGLTGLSYRQLDGLIHGYAEALNGLGLDVGDRVVVESDTSAAAVAVLLACSLLGLPFVPVSPQTPDHLVQAILQAVEPALYARADGVHARELPASVNGAQFGRGSALCVERRNVRKTRRRGEVLATDTAYIAFTSGSTGRPKGVVMSHRAVVAFLRALRRDGLAGPDDRIASTSPLQCGFTLFGIGVALSSGATLVPVRREHLGSPRCMVTLLENASATQVHGVPSLWRSVLRHDRDLLRRLDRMRSVVFAGEEFPIAEVRQLQSALPGVRLINGYGAIESMAVSFTDVPEPIPAQQDRLSIGFAHTGAGMTLIDREGRVVDRPGSIGEIYVRSPSLFTGYWDDPDATAAVLVNDPVDPRHGQRVLRTGDLARLGDSGELYVLGRA